jgi:hypothetical protein
MGGGVGEDVREGVKPQVRVAGNGEPAGGGQRPDLADRAGDGRAVHPEELCQGRVRELEPQVNEGDDDPVGEGQLVIRPGARGTQPVVTTAFTQPGLFSDHPGAGQASDEPAEAPRLQAGEDTLGQGRAGQVLRHNNTQLARPFHVPAVPRSLSRTTS